MMAALPPASGIGYDPRGPRLWKAGRQLTWEEIERNVRHWRLQDEQDLNQRADAILGRRGLRGGQR